MIPYKLKFFHREYIKDGTLISKDTYKFKTRLSRVYFIELERYHNSLYIAKFYLRIHKNLENKYKYVVNDGDGFRILSTCVSLARIITEEDPLASFGFVGECRMDEQLMNTQRYRVYKMLSAKYFDPKKYDHVQDEVNSIYFLLNKTNTELSVDLVSKRLNDYYDLS